MSNKEAIKIHRKAFADVHRLCPRLFPSILLYSLVEAVSPYVTIYLSARLIDELAGLRRPSVLWGWVAWTVGAGCAPACFAGRRWRKRYLQSSRNSCLPKSFSRWTLPTSTSKVPTTCARRFCRISAGEAGELENWHRWHRKFPPRCWASSAPSF